jgi:phosphate-selective porin OprO/OprP
MSGAIRSTFLAAALLAAARTLAASESAQADAAPRSGVVSTNIPSGESEVKSDAARLKQEVRIIVSTNAPPESIEMSAPGTAGGETNAVATKKKNFHWNFAWKGWDGLQMEAVQTTSLKTPAPVWRLMGIHTNEVPVLDLEQVKLSGKFGARADVDGAGFVTTGNLTDFNNEIQLRRLLLYARGDCIVVVPFSYYLELGYNGGQFSLTKSYLLFSNIKFIGNLKLGQFQPPMGLQLITSSRDLEFMEPAAPLQAIAPGVEAGLQIGNTVFHERATWSVGIFAPGAGSSEYGNASQDYGSMVLRFTGLPLYHPDSTDPSANRLLHLGLSANLLYSSSSTVRYQSRPESHIAPFVIDTGDIQSRGAATFGTEAAWVNGPFNAQGEFIYSIVEQVNGDNLHLYGFYGQAGWFLTGETRPYDPRAGAFARVIPRHNFNFSKGGWGALEVACRYSYSDLNDANVNGGKLGLFMAGVNWYLHPHVRWMFDYGMGRVTGGAQSGNMFIFQTRIGADF